MRRRDLWKVSGSLVLGVGLGIAGTSPVWAQNLNQFGAQDRADAASRMIVLGVQQGISSLPPTSGQSFVYEFEPDLGTYVPSELLGPTSFRTAQTIGRGRLSLRGAVSYFELSDTFGPIDYLVEFDEPFASGPNQGLQPAGVSRFGLKARAHVGLFNLAASYGLSDMLEVTVNVPVVIVDAAASQISTTSVANAALPPSEASAAGAFQGDPLSSNPAIRQEQIEALQGAFDDLLAPPDGPCTASPTACLTFRRDSFGSMGFDFNSGTHVGVGRISLGMKALLIDHEVGKIAFSNELFFPSPSEKEFAGSETSAILPRLIGQMPVYEQIVQLHGDIGYDYDFSEAELRRLVWNAGTSIALMQGITFDLGVGGSVFDEPIRWTPPRAFGVGMNGNPPSTTLTALGDTSLGTNYVDFLGGVKVKILEQTVLSGAVNVPLNDDGFRPAAVGTLALETYF